MNGELLLKGYKFPEKRILNLQDKTILTGDDDFTAFEIFNMLESYFNRKAFSDHYLDRDTVLILNGNKLSGDEFAVFRLHPSVDLSEELKISKKSILGQVVIELFPIQDINFSPITSALEICLLKELNSLTAKFGVSYIYEGEDIFPLAKILVPTVKEQGGQDILAKEHDQFYCKSMLVDLVSKLKSKKKKLLLVELPEYGLRCDETKIFFGLLVAASIDNIIIHTHNKDIIQFVPRIFNYNVLNKGKVVGFDDYDQLEKELTNVLIGSPKEDIEQRVMKYIFRSPHNLNYGEEFISTVEAFLN